MVEIGHYNFGFDLGRHQLGDFALYYSIFAHFKDVKFYTNSKHMSDDHKFFRAMKYWDGLFNVEVVQGTAPETALVPSSSFPEFAKEHGVKMAVPTVITKPDMENYITYQTVGNTIKKTPVQGIMELVENTGKEAVCIDHNSLPLDEFFGLLYYADEHIGSDSGPCWLACGMDKKVTMVLPPNDHRHGWRDWGLSLYPDTFTIIEKEY